MRRYTLHYNSLCQDCVRMGVWNKRLDWLVRFQRTSEPSPMGMPEIGDIHVVDHRTATIYSGAYATERVCRNIPAYWPMALLMLLPFVFNKFASRKPGCNGNSCTIQ